MSSSSSTSTSTSAPVLDITTRLVTFSIVIKPRLQRDAVAAIVRKALSAKYAGVRVGFGLGQTSSCTEDQIGKTLFVSYVGPFASWPKWGGIGPEITPQLRDEPIEKALKEAECYMPRGETWTFGDVHAEPAPREVPASATQTSSSNGDDFDGMKVMQTLDYGKYQDDMDMMSKQAYVD